MPSVSMPHNSNSLPLNVYNIPSGTGFAAALVAGVLQETGGDPLALSQYKILLPTRRGCRVIRDMFLQQSEGKPLILPRLMTLGDIDEDELSLQLQNPHDLAAFLKLKPAIPSTRRRLLLAQIVQQRDRSLAFGQALGLADTLTKLLDQVETEGLSLKDLPDLVPETDLAIHWQQTITFLEILSAAWPLILEEKEMMGAAARRDALLRLQANIWEHTPPRGPVIAAGSTGSLPATAVLLKTIASLPQGRVILPGLDQEMDQAGWEAIDESHPQATLRNLLQHFGLDRAQIPIWFAAANIDQDRSKFSRRKLASQMMRPAAESHSWTGLQLSDLELCDAHQMQKLQQNLWQITCATPEEEARLTALALRRTLETPGKTAALITPDRNLARRVSMACRRWGIEVDDSAGIPLGDTPIGTFILLILETCSKNLTPSSLLPLLQHELCGFGQNQSARTQAIHALDKWMLRGPRPVAGVEGLRLRLQTVLTGNQGAKLQPYTDQINEIIDKIDHSFSPLLQHKYKTGTELLALLVKAAEDLADSPGLSGPERLWRGAAGEAASLFLSDLMAHADALPPVNLKEAGEILSRMMAELPVRTPVGVHPRLLILGQLEARLVQTDLMILGGLNEGSWPPDPGQDPWMSRPMRKRFGLPAPERSIALAAHDFVQCFCAPQVIMTRAARIDGKPTLPSRWLQRLTTILQAAGYPDPTLFPAEAQQLLALARWGDQEGSPQPAARPAPSPPEQHRLNRLSVTQVENLIANPYGIYAREILKLSRLDPVEKPVGAAERGNFVHDVLHTFIDQNKNYLPDNSEQIILDLGYVTRMHMSDDSSAWDYWWPRFKSLTRAFVKDEREWRQQASPAYTEITGTLDLPAGNHMLTLNVRADRIDRMHDGSYAIIDYKSAGEYKPKAIIEGRKPQLPLEALILEQGGFKNIGKAHVHYIAYWKLTGTRKGTEIIALENNQGLGDIIASTSEGFQRLIQTYAKADAPFICRPDPSNVPRYDDYKHLARVDEWANDDDAQEDVA